MITIEQRELRRQHIGSSDSAAIAGVSPFSTAVDVWLEKVYGTDDFESEAADLGNWLEGPLLSWAASELGVEIKPNVSVIAPDKILAANHDALVIGKREGIEAKSSGLLWSGAVSSLWGEEGSDEVPHAVMVQCQHQAYVSDLDIVWVPALLGGRGRVMFRVPRREDLIKDVTTIDLDFWHRWVETKKQPDDSRPSLDVAKRVKRVPNCTREVDPGLVAAFLDARDARLAAEDEEAAKEALLLAAAGDAEEIVSGLTRLTYFMQTQNRKAQEAKVIQFRKWGGLPRRQKAKA